MLRGSVVAHGGGLLLVGTPEYEPWHLAAHLVDEAAWSGTPELAPTLVRHDARPSDPAHLAVGPGRIEAARRGETLLVVAPDRVRAPLLERVHDARRAGVTVLALGPGEDDDLATMAHETLAVPDGSELDLDVVQHLVSAAARGERAARAPGPPPAARPALPARRPADGTAADALVARPPPGRGKVVARVGVPPGTWPLVTDAPSAEQPGSAPTGLRALLPDLAPWRASADFRRLWLSGLITNFGSFLTFVALPVQIKELTGSAAAVGAIGAVELVPLVVFGLYGGALADAWDKRKLILWSEAGQGVLCAALLVNALLPSPAVWPLYVIAAFASALTSIQRPALDSLIPGSSPTTTCRPPPR
ncbi:Enterobactin exporter EntS [Streptomyces glaucescens]